MSRETQSELDRRTFLGAAGGLALAMAATEGAAAQPAPRLQPSSRPTKLYPHASETRATRDLSGVWKFRADPDRVGERDGWFKGLQHTRLIPVPCSWNEIFDDLRNYTGGGWYQTDFEVESNWSGQRIHLRFGSVAYRGKVWLNGALIGEHIGPHLPFVFDVTGQIKPGAVNTLIVFVENDLRLDRVPAVPDKTRVNMHTAHYPQTTYDFFPYTGIHRPVMLFATPDVHIHDLTVKTSIAGRGGKVAVDLATSSNWSGKARAQIGGVGESVPVQVSGGKASLTIDVPNARLWSTEDPHLYQLTVTLDDGGVRDVYHLNIGIREIKVAGEKLLLNGKPVFLRGFGKHEDTGLFGRALNVPSIIRDFELLKWLGANSFRTSHYPYSDEAMQLADQYGLLVIDETPAVSLVFMDGPEIQQARTQQLKQDIMELVERDKNHPCVIMWSVANEPLTKPFHTTNPEPPESVARGTEFFGPMFDLFRQLDNTRPVTMVSLQGGPTDWQAFGDVICTNSYNGWYAVSGRLDDAAKAVEEEALKLRARHPGKPVMFTEFGADAVAGIHAQPPVMWSEEYQPDIVEMYIRTLEKLPFIIGTHPWAFADFRTSQSIHRVAAMNFKGAFTRERQPKMMAHRLRELWKPKS